MRRTLIAVAMTAASLVTASAQADQLFGTFEGTLASSLPTGTNFNLANATAALNPVPTYSNTTGVTNGAQSINLRAALSFDFGLALTESGGVSGLKNAWNSNDRLLFDVIVPQINTSGGTPDVDGFIVFLPAVNSDGTGGGFRQSPANLQKVGGGGDNAYNAGQVTFAWNYRAGGILFPADSGGPGGFTQFNLALNAGGLDSAPRVYLDNFRFALVPEPTTLAALVGVVSLVVRRRR